MGLGGRYVSQLEIATGLFFDECCDARETGLLLDETGFDEMFRFFGFRRFEMRWMSWVIVYDCDVILLVSMELEAA